MVLSRQGHLVDNAVHLTRVRVARFSWSTPQTIRHERDTPGISGRHRDPLEPGASRPGQLVDPAGHRALARDAQDCGSAPLALEPSVIRPGVLVKTAGLPTQAQVAWESASIPRIIGPGPRGTGQLDDPAGPRT